MGFIFVLLFPIVEEGTAIFNEVWEEVSEELYSGIDLWVLSEGIRLSVSYIVVFSGFTFSVFIMLKGRKPDLKSSIFVAICSIISASVGKMTFPFIQDIGVFDFILVK